MPKKLYTLEQKLVSKEKFLPKKTSILKFQLTNTVQNRRIGYA